jgi:hypothetical protein
VYVDVDGLKRHLVLCYLAVADKPIKFSELVFLIADVLKADGPIQISRQLNYMTEQRWISYDDGAYHLCVEGFVRYSEMAKKWSLGDTVKELRKRLKELL